jgi:hypothetical protein
MFEVGKILARHFQFYYWYVDLVCVGIRDGFGVFDVIEYRRINGEMKRKFLCRDKLFDEANEVHSDRAWIMSRQAGLECNLEGVNKWQGMQEGDEPLKFRKPRWQKPLR